MTQLKPRLYFWLPFLNMKPIALFVLGLALTVAGYFLWQIVAAFVVFFTFGSGAGHDEGTLLVGAGFLAVHVGVLSWLFRRRVLYTTWFAWAISAGLSLSLFAYFELYQVNQAV
jgi:hypothetical protein